MLVASEQEKKAASKNSLTQQINQKREFFTNNELNVDNQKRKDKQENFTLTDLDFDDDIMKSLIDKDTSTDGSYKMKK